MPIVQNAARRLPARDPRGSRLSLGVPSRVVPFALLIVLAVLLAACGAGSTPAPEAGANGVALVPGAAVTATIGPEGGELSAADPGGGRSYRLSVPAGAFSEPTQVTVSPIAAIEEFPLEGGLLGGVELTPEGAVFLVPVILEISLDPDQRETLHSALDDGQAVVGFDYRGDAASAADDLGIGHAEVADDGSTIRLTLFGFSGHGSGAGNPQTVPCNQPDPAGRARCEIQRIVHPPGGPADIADPAVRSQIADVFRDWLDELEGALDTSRDDPGEFAAAIAEALSWHSLAAQYGLVSERWSAAGDELAREGSLLETWIFAAWLGSFESANSHCLGTVRSGPEGGQDLDRVIALLELHDIAELQGLRPPALEAIPYLDPGQFCGRFELVADAANPSELPEGTSGELRFRIRDTSGAVYLDTQLSQLKPRIVADPFDPALVSASGDRLALEAFADVSALRSVPGDTDEGLVRVRLLLFGNTDPYASATASFDITPDPDATPAAIACSGSPATITNIDDDPENISIRFDGESTCAVVPDLNSDDDPDVIVGFDSDPGDSGWDASNLSGSGRLTNWSNDREGDQEIPPGTYTLSAEHLPTGRLFTVTFTVEVTLIDGGPDVRMTVRDVTIIEGGQE